MRPWIWLRVQAGILALFTLGHTLGTAAPHVRRGPQEAAVYSAMQSFRFPIMGFERSHWDFYRGFALSISVLLATLTVLAWQLSTVSRRDPRQALPMAITLTAGCAGLLVVGWRFFFGGPIVFSIVAFLCSLVCTALLAREGRVQAVA